MIVEAGLTGGEAGVLGHEYGASPVKPDEPPCIHHDVASPDPLERAAKHDRSPHSWLEAGRLHNRGVSVDDS